MIRKKCAFGFLGMINASLGNLWYIIGSVLTRGTFSCIALVSRVYTFSFIDQRLSQEALNIDPRAHVRQASWEFDNFVRITELRFTYQLKIDKIIYQPVSSLSIISKWNCLSLSTEVEIWPKNDDLSRISWLSFHFSGLESNQIWHQCKQEHFPNLDISHAYLYAKNLAYDIRTKWTMFELMTKNVRAALRGSPTRTWERAL